MYKMQGYRSESGKKQLEVSVVFCPRVPIRLTKVVFLSMKSFGFYTAEILLNSIYVITRLFKDLKHAFNSKLTLNTKAQAVKIELAKLNLQVQIFNRYIRQRRFSLSPNIHYFLSLYIFTQNHKN